MLFIGAEDIGKLITMKDASKSNRVAFAVQSRGEVRLSGRNIYNRAVER
jgi:hypothetical protein